MPGQYCYECFTLLFLLLPHLFLVLVYCLLSLPLPSCYFSNFTFFFFSVLFILFPNPLTASRHLRETYVCGFSSEFLQNFAVKAVKRLIILEIHALLTSAFDSLKITRLGEMKARKIWIHQQFYPKQVRLELLRAARVE